MHFSLLHGIVLGIVQALTEFLPISSSAHLVIVRALLHIPTLGATDLAIDAILQLGTVLAVSVYFFNDLWHIFVHTPLHLIRKKHVDAQEKNIFWGIIIGTIPILILGLVLEHVMENLFRGLWFVALFMFFGTLFMMLAEWYTKKQRVYKKQFTVLDGLWIGLAQVLSLFSGFSRSGATISGGLFCGFSRADAVRFSFLLSFPAIALSGLKKLYDIIPLITSHTLPVLPLIVGFVVSAIGGLAVIHYLLKFIRTHSFNVFIIYRLIICLVIVGILVL